MAVYFTADWHLGHAKILEHSHRQFEDCEAMSQAIRDSLNETVQADDTLWVLGDLAFKLPSLAAFMDGLMCENVHAIWGNHDDAARTYHKRYPQAFQSVQDYAEIKVRINGEEQSITLCHYAMKVWNKSHHGAWQLYGHSHGNLPDDPNALQMDVGVDCNNFRPFSLDDIAARMTAKTYKPVDHHTASTRR